MQSVLSLIFNKPEYILKLYHAEIFFEYIFTLASHLGLFAFKESCLIYPSIRLLDKSFAHVLLLSNL